MSLKNRFTAEDLDRIKAAVKQAEEQISGEIVPVFVERSGFYTIANYRGAIVFAALAFLAIIGIDRYVPEQYASTLAVYDPLMIFLIVITTGMAGALATHNIGPLKRLMLSQTHQLRQE